MQHKLVFITIICIDYVHFYKSYNNVAVQITH